MLVDKALCVRDSADEGTICGERITRSRFMLVCALQIKIIVFHTAQLASPGTCP